MEEKDFIFYKQQFEKEIANKVPSSGEIFFLNNGNYTLWKIEKSESFAEVDRYFSSNEEYTELACIHEGNLILSLSKSCEPTLLIVTEVDSYFTKKVSQTWLKDLSRQFSEMFLTIKRRETDFETGVRNVESLLNKIFHRFEQNERIVFLEIFPDARSSMQAKYHDFRIIHYLEHLFTSKVDFYVLGHHTFAFTYVEKNRKSTINYCSKLLLKFKRLGFKNIHMGISSTYEAEENMSSEDMAQRFFDEAWFALQGAKSKGPYAISDYVNLTNPASHPIKRGSANALQLLKSKWFKSDKFSLLLLKPIEQENTEKIIDILSDHFVIQADEGVYLYLEGFSPEDGYAFAIDLVKKIPDIPIQTGIASHPLQKYTKSSSLQRCIKALHHAEFYGENGVAVFDAVTLNISGDIYYSEGDVITAVKEYQEGVRLDDKNINLLNSLGVAYVDMDKHKLAKKCFNRALELSSTDFMSLYNRGLIGIYEKEPLEAIEYLTAIPKDSRDFPDMADDILYQLGVLYYETADYEKAISLLLKWYGQKKTDVEREKSLPYLGKAFYKTGQFRESMIWLQKALRFNEFNAELLGLLGTVYLELEEGDEIALSLIEKALDYEPDNVSLQLFLAKVQIKNGLYAEAKRVLRKSIRRKATRDASMELLHECYQREGIKHRADYWRMKIDSPDSGAVGGVN